MSSTATLKTLFDKLMEAHSLETLELYLSRPDELKEYAKRNFNTELSDADILTILEAKSFIKEELRNGNHDWEKLRSDAHFKFEPNPSWS